MRLAKHFLPKSRKLPIASISQFGLFIAVSLKIALTYGTTEYFILLASVISFVKKIRLHNA